MTPYDYLSQPAIFTGYLPFAERCAPGRGFEVLTDILTQYYKRYTKEGVVIADDFNLHHYVMRSISRRVTLMDMREWQRDQREPRTAPGDLPECIDERFSARALEVHIDVQRAIASLDPPYRLVAIEHFLNGRSIREVAALVGVFFPVMTWRVRKTKKLLQKALLSYARDYSTSAQDRVLPGVEILTHPQEGP